MINSIAMLKRTTQYLILKRVVCRLGKIRNFLHRCTDSKSNLGLCVSCKRYSVMGIIRFSDTTGNK
ncbi:hypothetical protein D3C87_467380 [compost metagenome]